MTTSGVNNSSSTGNGLPPQDERKVRITKRCHALTAVYKNAQEIKNLTKDVEKVNIKEPSSFTYGSHGLYDVMADVSAFIRNGFALIPSFDGAAFASLGVTTAANAITGTLASINAGQKFITACKIQDIWAGVLNGIQTIGHAAQGLAGAVFFPLRGYTIASLVDAAKHAGQVAPNLVRGNAITGLLGTVLFGIYFLCLAVMAVGYVGESLKFKWDLNHASNKAAFLEKCTLVDPKEILKNFKKKYPNWKKRLQEIGKAEASKLKAVFKAEASKLKAVFKEDESKKLVDGVKINKAFARQTAEEFGINVDGLNETQVLGLITEISREQARFENKLMRVLGGKGKEIQKAMLAQNPDTKKIVAMLNEAQNSTLKENGILLTCFAIGIPVSVLGLLKATMVYNIVIAALYALQGLLYLFPDYPAWMGALASSEVGRHDKMLVYANMVLLALAMATAIGVTAAFSFGIAPLIITLVGGAIWMILNKRALDKIHRFENLEQDTINTVDRLKLYIEKNGVDEKKINKILAKNPKIKKHFWEKLFEADYHRVLASKDKAELLAVIQDGEQARLERKLSRHPILRVHNFRRTDLVEAI